MKWPIAVYCCICPCPIKLTFEGLTVIEDKFANVMFTLVDPLTMPDVAVMVAEPAVIPFTSPVLVTVAMLESEVVQSTLPVSVLVVPSS